MSIYVYIIPGKKFNNDGNQKVTHAVSTNFVFGFGLIFPILRRFFALKRRF